jgi:hypothetical protein
MTSAKYPGESVEIGDRETGGDVVVVEFMRGTAEESKPQSLRGRPTLRLSAHTLAHYSHDQIGHGTGMRAFGVAYQVVVLRIGAVDAIVCLQQLSLFLVALVGYAASLSSRDWAAVFRFHSAALRISSRALWESKRS